MSEFKGIESSINLRDIKSSNIIKEIFSFMNKKQILNIIIYNKELKKMLLFNIEDYIKISGKYKIEEKNEKGREYELNKDKLKIIGKRNGKGKEYFNNGKLKFGGEYLDGKIWTGKGYTKKGNMVYQITNGTGHIKVYDNDRELIFEGEYLNGKRNGKGKEYDYFGILKYEAEYLNGSIIKVYKGVENK